MNQLDELCVNTIRMLSVDAVQQAKSGHPGAPMGQAVMAYVLWDRHLRHNPANPKWPGRDRFILSSGHASMLLYSLLHLTGYDLSLDEIKRFRQLDSKTPGHPEYGLVPGAETTTGPLGQGFATGVGMAIAQRYLADTYNRPGHTVLDSAIYCICSDGDLMEGVASEAASLAGHLGLGRLVYLYDDNRITIDGSTELAFTEDRGKRFEAYGWHVQHVDGLDGEAVDAAITAAKAETARPSIIVCRTHIAYGSPNKVDTAGAHGSPLGEEEVRLTKENLGWPAEPPFYIPDEALAHFRATLDRGAAEEAAWSRAFEAYAADYPAEAAALRQQLDGQRPAGWDADIPVFPATDGALATRVASGRVINAVAPRLPALFGGDADLAPSTETAVKGSPVMSASEPGRNVAFGVREHAMGAAVNGMALYGGIIPYGSTFLVFSDYMRGALRLGALMELPVISVFTHDTIGLGEDGPTHQPIEQLAGLRAIPHMVVLRPADANETAEAWRWIIEAGRPTSLVLTRQNLPILDRGVLAPAAGLRRGAYVLAGEGDPDLVLIAAGSEVHLALAAAETLAAEGTKVRVISAPSLELFREQPREYRDSVLPPSVKARVAVEAAASQPWWEFVGLDGDVVGLDRFGASAPGAVAMKALGFTPENVATRARAVLDRLGVVAR